MNKELFGKKFLCFPLLEKFWFKKLKIMLENAAEQISIGRISKNYFFVFQLEIKEKLEIF